MIERKKSKINIVGRNDRLWQTSTHECFIFLGISIQGVIPPSPPTPSLSVDVSTTKRRKKRKRRRRGGVIIYFVPVFIVRLHLSYYCIY